VANERENICCIIQAFAPVDAIYLYGSRAKQTAHENSDWDIAIIFTNYETDLQPRALRPQLLEAEIEIDILPALKGYNGDSLLLRSRCVSLLPTGFCC
jgi:predicted nucleotidyltransferase